MEKIHEVERNLFISSLKAANHLESLNRCKIGTIISIGCETEHSIQDFHYIKFLDVQDSPNVSILPVILHVGCELLLPAHKNVLFHCVYGQSRSVAVLVGYLMIFSKFDLTASLDRIKEKDICVNPGFLSQLYLLQIRSRAIPLLLESESIPPEGRKFLSEYMSHDSDPPVYSICCRLCKEMLCQDNVVLHDERHGLQKFLHQYLDPFWVDYSSSYSQKDHVTVPYTGHLVVAPLPLLKVEGVNSASSLCCSACKAPVGIFQRKKLLLCNGHRYEILINSIFSNLLFVPASPGHLRVNLYALSLRSIFRRRVRLASELLFNT
jgi:hypothetical protein